MLDTQYAPDKRSGKIQDKNHWQDRARLALASCGQQVADAILPNSHAAALQLSLIKSGPLALSLRVELGESITSLKVYDQTNDAQQAYLRERSALMTMRTSRLVPYLKAYSDVGRFLVMEPEQGTHLVGGTKKLRQDDLAYRIGTWIAHFDTLAPSHATSGNWFSYLTKFGDSLGISQIRSAQQVLSDIPLCGLALARNDGALHDFMMRPNGGLFVSDFEQATLRPRGWDYMLAYRALLQWYPENADVVLAAFHDGFSQFHRGALIAEELSVVACTLFRPEAT